MAQQTHLIKFLTEVAGTARLKDLQKTIDRLSQGQLRLGKSHGVYQKGVKGSITQDEALAKVQKQGSAIINARTGATKSMTAASRANAAAEKEAARAKASDTSAAANNTSATNQNTAATKKNTLAKKQNVDVSGSAGMAVTSLGQAFADSSQFAMGAAQGIRATTNNIQQVGTAMAYLAMQTGGMTAGFKAMWTAAMGPLGVLFAFQAITAAIDFFSSKAQMAESEAKELTSSLEDLLNVTKQDFSIDIAGSESGLRSLTKSLREAEKSYRRLADFKYSDQLFSFSVSKEDQEALLLARRLQAQYLRDAEEAEELALAQQNARIRSMNIAREMGSAKLNEEVIDSRLLELGEDLEESYKEQFLLKQRHLTVIKNMAEVQEGLNEITEARLRISTGLAATLADQTITLDIISQQEEAIGLRAEIRRRAEIVASERRLSALQEERDRLFFIENLRQKIAAEGLRDYYEEHKVVNAIGDAYAKFLDDASERSMLERQLTGDLATQLGYLQKAFDLRKKMEAGGGVYAPTYLEVPKTLESNAFENRMMVLETFNQKIRGSIAASEEWAAAWEDGFIDFSEQEALERLAEGFENVGDKAKTTGEVIRTLADLSSTSLGNIGTAYMTLAKTGDTVNEQMFETGKKFAMAQAIINIAVGVTKAFEQGGFLGFAMAASVAAAGQAQLQVIASAKPGSSPKSSVGSGSVGNFTNLVAGISNVSELPGLATTSPGTALTAGSAAPAAKMGTAVTIKNSGRDLVLTLRNELAAQRRMGVRDPLGISNA